VTSSLDDLLFEHPDFKYVARKKKQYFFVIHFEQNTKQTKKNKIDTHHNMTMHSMLVLQKQQVIYIVFFFQPIQYDRSLVLLTNHPNHQHYRRLVAPPPLHYIDHFHWE
jgi:hypothetical protein